MKSEIIKYGYSKNRSRSYFIIFFFFIFFFSFQALAQNFNFKFNNTPLSQAISEVAQKTKVRVSFDADRLRQLKVTAEIRESNINSVFDILLKNTNYYYDIRYDTYLILKKSDDSESSGINYKILSGIVFDTNTKERLPFATIYSFDTRLATSSNVEGSFSLRLPDSELSVPLKVSYLGYQTLDTVILINANEQLIRIGLIQKMQAIEQVDVAEARIDMLDVGKEAGHVTFNPSRFIDLPNYGENDIFRGLQLLPGISSFENSSQLNVRGSSADQNLVLLDGFTLYNLDHFFGVFSALNPNVIKNIQVYRGGFDSRYGERVSAIVDIIGKSGTQTKPQVYGGINMISANLTAEIPISKKFTVVAAARRAYTDVFSSWLADELLNDKLGQTRLPVPDANVISPKFYFSDYNLKLSYKLNEQENISFSLYGSKDYLNSSNNNSFDRGNLDVEDINEWGNYGFGITWNKQWGPRFFSSLQLGHSGYFNDYQNTTLINQPPPDAESTPDTIIEEVVNESNRLKDYFISYRSEYTINHRNQLEFGAAIKYHSFSFYKDASRDFIYDNLKSSAFLYSSFIQDKIRMSDNLILKPGLRLNYYTNSERFYLEPRLAATYSCESGVAFKLALGKYYQFISKSGTEQNFGYNRDFWVLSDADVNPVVSSNHFIGGLSFETGDFYFDIEAYYKKIYGLQEYLFLNNHERRSPEEQSDAGFSRFVKGDGEARGIDFMAKYEGANYTSWLAYSISKSTRRFDVINDGGEIPASFDQTHEIKWTNIYNLNKWNFSAIAIYNTGKPYLQSSIVDTILNSTRVYNRLPDYFRVDLSANYNFNIKNVNIKPGLSVLNAFNTDNYLDAYLRVFDFGDTPQTETTLIKAQSLTFNFFVNFRF